MCGMQCVLSTHTLRYTCRSVYVNGKQCAKWTMSLSCAAVYVNESVKYLQRMV